MDRPPRSGRCRGRRLLGPVVAAGLMIAVTAGDAATAAPAADLAGRGWIWPAEQFRIDRPFLAPAHEYGPGHRGIDLALSGDHGLRAPADGTIAFSGVVVDRGVLTVDHGDGLVTTLEPVESDLVVGTSVRKGDVVAVLSSGGHAAPGSVHFGVRWHGDYINPLLLLGGVPLAVLLPCC